MPFLLQIDWLTQGWVVNEFAWGFSSKTVWSPKPYHRQVSIIDIHALWNLCARDLFFRTLPSLAIFSRFFAWGWGRRHSIEGRTTGVFNSKHFRFFCSWVRAWIDNPQKRQLPIFLKLPIFRLFFGQSRRSRWKNKEARTHVKHR